MASMYFSVSVLWFDPDGVFIHRSRLGPARNAEGVTVLSVLPPRGPRRDSGCWSGRCFFWVTADATGCFGRCFLLISVTLLGIDSMPDWSQCAGGFFLSCFFLAGWLDSAAKSSPPYAPFPPSRYLYSSFSWFLMGAWVPLCG